MVSSHSPLPRMMTSYLDDIIPRFMDFYSEASSMVCPFEGFKSMVVKAIKTQEMCKL